MRHGRRRHQVVDRGGVVRQLLGRRLEKSPLRAGPPQVRWTSVSISPLTASSASSCSIVGRWRELALPLHLVQRLFCQAGVGDRDAFQHRICKDVPAETRPDGRGGHLSLREVRKASYRVIKYLTQSKRI